jgi:hypothetical protein
MATSKHVSKPAGPRGTDGAKKQSQPPARSVPKDAYLYNNRAAKFMAVNASDFPCETRFEVHVYLPADHISPADAKAAEPVKHFLRSDRLKRCLFDSPYEVVPPRQVLLAVTSEPVSLRTDNGLVVESELHKLLPKDLERGLSYSAGTELIGKSKPLLDIRPRKKGTRTSSTQSFAQGPWEMTECTIAVALPQDKQAVLVIEQWAVGEREPRPDPLTLIFPSARQLIPPKATAKPKTTDVEKTERIGRGLEP